ncbi:AAA family ATPase [Spirosoma soli]|uniref:AAA family ATPase n=1 Tax=Spirosoma soli TaxID=1770529 RepID=A0ABW5M8Q2_9BACT
MNIKRLVIENFKSIERIELIEPNPFTVFVGPNGSGKSNIFEALEFVNRCSKTLVSEVVREFGGVSKISYRSGAHLSRFYFRTDFGEETEYTEIRFAYDAIQDKIHLPNKIQNEWLNLSTDTQDQFYLGFSKVFINSSKSPRYNYQDDRSLNSAATNLEKVLKRILLDDKMRPEIFEWLFLFVPGFDYVSIDEHNEIQWYEKYSVDHFTKDLISDGTYNILALLTAVYQSDKPQFLCIEEPENGLHPDVIKELVNLCRYACETYGHFIWLNTHSQTLAAQLTSDEIIVVDKVNGATQTKQFKGRDFHGLRMDEAWLMNALGGGLPW